MSYSFNEYYEASKRTMNPFSEHLADDHNRKATAALGLAGEAGELAEIFLGGNLDLAWITKEGGDCAWYMCFLCHLYDIDIRSLANGYETPDLFQEACSRRSRSFEYLCLRLCSLAGKIADCVKKETGHGHPAMSHEIEELLELYLFYLAAIMDKCELKLSYVFSENVKKLFNRYPNGFNPTDSMLRME